MKKMWTIVYEIAKKLKLGMLFIGMNQISWALMIMFFRKSVTNTGTLEDMTRMIEILPITAWIMILILLIQFAGDYLFPSADAAGKFREINHRFYSISEMADVDDMGSVMAELRDTYQMMDLSEEERLQRLQYLKMKQVSCQVLPVLLVTMSLALAGTFFVRCFFGFSTPFFTTVSSILYFTCCPLILKMGLEGTKEKRETEFSQLEEKMLKAGLSKEEQE